MEKQHIIADNEIAFNQSATINSSYIQQSASNEIIPRLSTEVLDKGQGRNSKTNSQSAGRYAGNSQKSKIISHKASQDSEKTVKNTTERIIQQNSAVSDYLVSVVDHEALNVDVKLMPPSLQDVNPSQY